MLKLTFNPIFTLKRVKKINQIVWFSESVILWFNSVSKFAKFTLFKKLFYPKVKYYSTLYE